MKRERKGEGKEKVGKARGGECDTCLIRLSGRKFPPPPFMPAQCRVSTKNVDIADYIQVSPYLFYT